jgi:Icc protein
VALALVAIDSSKPDLDKGEIGREHYRWIEEGVAGEADLRIFVRHHHLVPVPGTGRERNQVLQRESSMVKVVSMRPPSCQRGGYSPR